MVSALGQEMCLYFQLRAGDGHNVQSQASKLVKEHEFEVKSSISKGLTYMIDWKLQFDKIYCIHYFKQKERLPRISTELKRVGILDSGVFEWFYDYDSPFFKVIQKNSTPSKTTSWICDDQSFSYFKCSFSHYRIWKEVQAREYKRVLILEDDEVFLKDLNLLDAIVCDIPSDDGIHLLDKFSCCGQLPYIANLQDKRHSVSNYFRSFDLSLKLYSGGAYSISNSAAELFSQFYEDALIQCDNIWNTKWFESTNLKKSFAIINACYQAPYQQTNCNQVDFDLAYSQCGLDKSLYQEY